MVGRSPRADTDTPKRRAPQGAASAALDPTTSWGALLVTPTRAVQQQ